MKQKKIFKTVRWSIALTVLLTSVLFFFIGINRLRITTDILEALPLTDDVISDAKDIFKNHPAIDRVLVDITVKDGDKVLLTEVAQFINKEMVKSGLFKTVGMDNFNFFYPQLMDYIVSNLPSLFSEEDLINKIKPLISESEIFNSFEKNYEILQGLEGVGHSQAIMHDPLNFRTIIFSKLRNLFQFENVKIYNGHIISKDERHLLLFAEQEENATDFKSSKKILDLLEKISKDVQVRFGKEQHISITPTGVFRAVYDNESSIRKDVSMALTIASIGILILMLVSFRRPLLGFLAFIPSIFGTLSAIFFYSLFLDDLSMVVLGFGGAIISITIDHAIALLLFIDRPVPLSVKDAAYNVKHLGLLAVLTTVGAFFSLSLSGFHLLLQIGLFSGLGILSSYVFIHTIYPMIFSKMKLDRSDKRVFFSSLAEKIGTGNRGVLAVLTVLFLLFVFNMKFDFAVDLDSLNSVSEETLKAEEKIKQHWGNLLDQVFILVEGKDINEIQNRNDLIKELFKEKVNNKEVLSYFSVSSLFPGESLLIENKTAWDNFWSKKRVDKVYRAIKKNSDNLGFEINGFSGFINKLKQAEVVTNEIPEDFHKFFGIKQTSTNKYVHISSFKKGKNYKGEEFSRFVKTKIAGKIFDSSLFNNRLEDLLSHTFMKMFILVGVAVFILLFLFFADIKLTCISFIPIVFAVVSTIGTLSLLNVKIGLPGLMLAIIIFGMGIDYSIFIVRSFQRDPVGLDETKNIVKVTVMLASFSTLIGFGVLIFVENALLQSIGLVAFLGIGYSFIGAIFILPPILRVYFKPVEYNKKSLKVNSREHLRAVLDKYKRVEPYPRFFARYKIKFDPMFLQLGELVENPRKIIDIGAGFGVPLVWLLELYPEATVHAIEPDIERARISSLVFNGRGTCVQGAAPDLSALPGDADIVLLLDMIHYLDEEKLIKTFDEIKSKLISGGELLIRATIPSDKKIPWERFLEQFRLKVFKVKSYFRTVDEIKVILQGCGFSIDKVSPTCENREETWIVAKV